MPRDRPGVVRRAKEEGDYIYIVQKVCYPNVKENQLLSKLTVNKLLTVAVVGLNVKLTPCEPRPGR